MTYRVCIAEDEQFIRKGLEKRLEQCGQSFELAGSADDGVQGVELYRALSPDIFFVDINMPRLSGLEMIEEAKKLGATRTKFVIISGYDDFAYLQRSIRLGVASYLKKPVVQEELQTVLDEICAEIEKERKLYGKEEEGKRSLFLDDLLQSQQMEQQLRALPGRAYFWRAEESLGLEARGGIAAVENELKKVVHPQLLICAALRDAPAACFFLAEENFNQENANRADNFFRSLTYGMAAGTTLDGSEQHRVLERLDEAHAKRFFGEKGRLTEAVEFPSHKDKVVHVLADALESSDEGMFTRLLHRELDSCCSSPSLCSTLPQLYRALCLAMMEKMMAYEIPITESLKNELRVFALAKFSSITVLEQSLTLQAEGINKSIRKRVQSGGLAFQVAAYLQQHYDEDLSLKDLANLFFITPTYLSKWFKDKTGATITQFVENLRMERARELLEYTSLSVGEIGRRVGYEDSNYFSRVFKKIYGIPPSKWPRI